MKPNEKIANEYISSLQSSLKNVQPLERDEVVAEITAHIRDSLEQGLTIEQILSRLGDAKELAAQYRSTVWVNRAARARSPWSMLQSLARLAKTGATGAACFLIALIGYVSAAGLFITALMKPFFPDQIGFWVGPGVLHFGFHEAGRAGGGVGFLLVTGAPARDVLGPWYIPVTCVLAVVLIWGTTIVVRRLVKRIRTNNTQFMPRPLSPRPLAP